APKGVPEECGAGVVGLGDPEPLHSAGDRARAPVRGRAASRRTTQPPGVSEMARILPIPNPQGGVGQTTPTVHLAAALATEGHRVLVVDLDPQGNASSGLGYPRSDVTMGVYDALLEFRDLESVRMPTALDALQVVPATRDLVGAELELVDAQGRERK